jgi:hypothetical protein
MEITIIERSFEIENCLKQGKQLWCVAPFAENINWTSMVSNFLSYCVPGQELTERFRVNFYKLAIKGWNTDIKPELLEESYQISLQIKKMKHKDKKALVFLHNWKNDLEKFHRETLNYLKHIEKQFHIEELQPLFSLPRKGVLSLYSFDDYQPEDYSYIEIEILTTTIINNFEIPLFSDEAEKYITTKEEHNTGSNTKALISKHKLLKFISPSSLSYSKLEIIRNRLVPMFKPLADFLEEYNSELLLNKFNDTLLEKLNDKYLNYILPEVSKIQDAINDDIYFNQIINSTDETEIFTLYLCVTDINSMLDLFHKVSNMPKATVENAREELKDKIDLESAKLFLYLKTERS